MGDLLLLSDLLFNLIVQEKNTLPTFEDVDEEIRSTIEALQKTVILSEAQNLITDSNVFSIAGYNFIFQMEEKQNIIQGNSNNSVFFYPQPGGYLSYQGRK